MHWLGEGQGCDPTRLRDLDRVRRALDAVAPALGLVKVGGPTVHANEDGSIVGVVLLAESHTSIHIPPTGQAYLADVFSCAPFDVARAEALFADSFGGSVSGRVVHR